jgi:tRNA G18 (ribose-2'-O)-methylase SpoU
LVVGNEVFGIDDDVLEACDSALEIPMHGMKHSLNVSVAAGVALFELVRQMSLPLDPSTSLG